MKWLTSFSLIGCITIIFIFSGCYTVIMVPKDDKKQIDVEDYIVEEEACSDLVEEYEDLFPILMHRYADVYSWPSYYIFDPLLIDLYWYWHLSMFDWYRYGYYWDPYYHPGSRYPFYFGLQYRINVRYASDTRVYKKRNFSRRPIFGRKIRLNDNEIPNNAQPKGNLGKLISQTSPNKIQKKSKSSDLSASKIERSG